jgi:hypothetical protein
MSKKLSINLNKRYFPDFINKIQDLSNINDVVKLKIESDKGTYEMRDAEYQEFIAKQTEIKMPSLTDIQIETLGVSSEFLIKIKERIRTFVNDRNLDEFYYNMLYSEILFKIMGNVCGTHEFSESEIESIVQTEISSIQNSINNKTVYPASIPGGYGDHIDICNEPPEVPLDPKYDFGTKELITYTTPQEASSALVSSKHKMLSDYATITLPAYLEDYSHGNLCDYKVAYTSTIDESQTLLASYNSNSVQTYESLLEERMQFDEVLLHTYKKC